MQNKIVLVQIFNDLRLEELHFQFAISGTYLEDPENCENDEIHTKAFEYAQKHIDLRSDITFEEFISNECIQFTNLDLI